MEEYLKRIKSIHPPESKKSLIPFLTVSILLLITCICLFSYSFYHTLEREIYEERTTYLKEISSQIVTATDAMASTQWDFSQIFASRLLEAGLQNREQLTACLKWNESSFAQKGMSLLVFDSQGNYYDVQGNKARWLEGQSALRENTPVQQVKITTLPTATIPNDQMIFIHRLPKSIVLKENKTKLTHIAVVRDMSVFNDTLQVPFFDDQGESCIISSDGTRVYRGESSSDVMKDAYNILKPLKTMKFQYDGSYEKLYQSVTKGNSSSMTFTDEKGERYYITTSPMNTNHWSLISIVPADVVSAGMQHFMHLTILGIGAIAVVIIGAFSLAFFLIVRYRAGQRRIQQQVQVNAALQEAAQAAQEANRAKSVFLSHMSHDIRTPINGIMGMADIAVRNSDDQNRVIDCLKKITSASTHLLSLINDVLDMSRIESGKVQLEEKPFSLNDLLESCYSVVLGQALERKLVLNKDFSTVDEQNLCGDELHLRQILINILGNAIKFTPEGGTVSFKAETTATDEKTSLTISVQDNGIGMSEAYQKKIFEPFSQAEDNNRSHYQGTGLGMSIVKELMDLMGGTITLQSAPGKGSTFIIQLQLPIVEQAAQPQLSANDEINLTGIHVLLVEDNDLNMEIAQFILEECHATITPVWNGREALNRYIKEPSKSFDIILMDIMMPVMNGLEAAQAIRKSGKEDAETIPIIAMTANAYEDDKQEVLKAGMNSHLTKPIEREKLLKTIHEFVC